MKGMSMELDKEIEDIGADEVIEIAIRSEMDAQKAYKKLLKSDFSPEMKERVKEFVKQEAGHEEKLRDLFRDWYPDKELQMPEKVMNIEGKIEKIPSDPRKLLKLSIRNEKKAEEIYSELGDRMEEKPEYKTFKHLAYIERQHRNALKDELAKIE